MARVSKTTKSLTRYVVFSISMMIIYTIVAMIFIWFEKSLDAEVSTGVYGFFGGEIVLCCLIKLLKLKGEKDQ